MKKFDVLIVGAGPAGCAAALQLAKQNFSIGIIEKAKFPRDKTCGDALSPDVIKQIQSIDENLFQSIVNFGQKCQIKKLHLFDPNNYRIDFNLEIKKELGFTMKRFDFDNLLFQELTKRQNIEIFENQKISSINVNANHAKIVTQNQIFNAEIILGADGTNSIVKRFLSKKEVDKNHYSGGLRRYFKNVTPFEENDGIELHFFHEALPGYLWIFPLGSNKWNIGIGILSSTISKKNINLKKLLDELITNHPRIKSRFKNATPLEQPQGYGMPIGSKKVNCSGNRFLLLGDAASLIDPFTGEGIANAIRSGRVASEHLKNAFANGVFNANFNKAYDKEIYKRLWPEFKVSRIFQNSLRYPKLFSFIVRKAHQSISFRNYIVTTAFNSKLPDMLKQPKFYFKLLFSRK